MKYSLNINQPKAIELGLNLTQAIIFDMLVTAPAWANTVIIDGEVYFWVSRMTIVEELPLLGLKPDTVYRNLKKLADLGVIDYKKDGKKDCINITPKGKSYLIREDNNSDINPKKLGYKSEKNSDLNPTDKNTNIHQDTNNNNNKKINKKSSSKKMSWSEISNERKKEIRADIKKILSPLISLEYFESSLLAKNYKYVDFVMAYKNWVLKAESKNKTNNGVDELNINANTNVAKMTNAELDAELAKYGVC